MRNLAQDSDEDADVEEQMTFATYGEHSEHRNLHILLLTEYRVRCIE